MLKNTLDYRMVKKNKKFINEDNEKSFNKKEEILDIKKVKSRKKERVRVRKK